MIAALVLAAVILPLTLLAFAAITDARAERQADLERAHAPSHVRILEPPYDWQADQ